MTPRFFPPSTHNKPLPGRRGRYAPSPTGPLHLGNLRTALLAWLQARLSGAHFLMRMEDLDQPRMQAGCAEPMLQDLQWLGLDWDEGPGKNGSDEDYYQAKRTAVYDAALAYLNDQGLVYRCYCSRKDIRLAASAPHGNQGMPPYPGTCRNLTPAEEATVIKTKPQRTPAWRFKAPSQQIVFEDQITGTFHQTLDREVGDFVVKRSDGLYAYQLAVVVDDGLMGVTDVLRGADLLDSTPRQIALYQAFGFPFPNFWHVPLVHNARGERLAKRDGSAGLAGLRQEGYSANRVIGTLAASLGWVPFGESLSAQSLCHQLSLEQFKNDLREPPSIAAHWTNFSLNQEPPAENHVEG